MRALMMTGFALSLVGCSLAYANEACKTEGDVTAAIAATYPDIRHQAITDTPTVQKLADAVNEAPPETHFIADSVVIYGRPHAPSVLVILFNKGCHEERAGGEISMQSLAAILGQDS